MGGFGSGRHWYYKSKETISHYWSLDIRRWQKDKLLKPGLAFNWQWISDGKVTASIQVCLKVHQAILTYRHRRGEGEWKDEKYAVQLDWTNCNYGGQRAWFICPASGCGRRVAILYGNAIFVCRHCHRLVYPSQRESDSDRATRRAEKIRRRLRWEPGILNGEGIKPKGMRWKTYKNLINQHSKLEYRILSEFIQLASRLKSKSSMGA